MKAIKVHEYGGPEVMRLEEAQTPEPGPGEALVRVEAAGVNFIDIYQRSGTYKLPLPFGPGSEGAGRVESVGSNVSEVKAGDRVAWKQALGSYATHVVAPVRELVPVPGGVGARDAAAVMLQGMTAHYLVHSTYPLKKSDTCVITAAAGGVGLLFCQMAKLRGARVIGLVSTEEKAGLARDAGADEVILYTQQDYEAEVKRLTDGEGVDVVYDSVGKDTFDKSLNCIRPRGYMVLFGASSGPVPPMDPQTLNAKGSLYLTRPSLGSYTATREELMERARDIFGLMEQGKLKLRTEHTYPLSDAAQAHRDLAGRRTTGKLLLLP